MAVLHLAGLMMRRRLPSRRTRGTDFPGLDAVMMVMRVGMRSDEQTAGLALCRRAKITRVARAGRRIRAVDVEELPQGLIERLCLVGSRRTFLNPGMP